MKRKVLVIGIGGAGGNVIDKLYEINALRESIYMDTTPNGFFLKSHKKLQLGEELCKGYGTGDKPEIGLAAAKESANEIESQVIGYTDVIIVATLDSGCGGGAILEIAIQLKALGKNIIAVAICGAYINNSKLFFEKHGANICGRNNSLDRFERGVAELKKIADIVHAFPAREIKYPILEHYKKLNIEIAAFVENICAKFARHN